LVAQLKARRANARAELSNLAGITNLPPGANATEVEEYRLLAQTLAHVCQEHVDEALKFDAVRQRLQADEQKFKAWTGFSEPGPYSVLFVDELRDSVQSMTARITAAETTRNVLATLAEDARANIKKSDEHLRLVAEQLETAVVDADKTTRLTWQRSLEQLRNRTAAAQAALNETRRRVVEAELAEQRQGLAFAKRQLLLAVSNVRFSQVDLDQVQSRLNADTREVEKELSEAERTLQQRQEQLTEAREQLAKAKAAEVEPAAPSSALEMSRLQFFLGLRDAQAETTAQHVVMLRNLAEADVLERNLWRMRFAAFQTKDLEELREGMSTWSTWSI
jgi:chromosome segregation ATPase